MSNGQNGLLPPHEELLVSLENEISELREAGIIDCHVKINVTPETTSASIVATLINALRLRRDGLWKPVDISDM